MSRIAEMSENAKVLAKVEAMENASDEAWPTQGIDSRGERQDGQLDKRLDEQSVVHFLQQHPQFFEGKESLLSSMLLSHPQTGETVSLLERQLGLLRAKSQGYQQQVNQYLDHAAANTEIFEKIETFSASLMRANSPQATVDCIYQQMQCLFAVDETSLHSFNMPTQSVDGLKQLGLDNRWSNALAMTLKVNHPICGAVEPEWRQGLFYQHQEIASVCLVPLGEQQVWGVLALGSLGLKFTGDETLFLKFIGKMVTAKLEGLFVSQAN